MRPLVLALAFWIPAALAEDPAPLKGKTQHVLAGKPNRFEYSIKNTGKKPLILAVSSAQKSNDECQALVPLEPIAPGKSAKIVVECQFLISGSSDDGAIRTPAVFINRIVPGEPVQAQKIQVDARVYKTQLPEKHATAAKTKESSDWWDRSFSTDRVRVVNSGELPRVKLYAEKCADLEPELKAIAQLKKKLEGGALPQIPPCACDTRESGKRRCSAVADTILPEVLFDEINVRPACDGPNCFNAALRMSGLGSHPLFSGSEDLRSWIDDTAFCREIPPGEKLAAGDIVAIRDGLGDLHAFTYLTDQLGYTKNGMSSIQPFIFASLDSIYSKYGVDGECRHVSAAKPGNCADEEHASVYRCQSVKEFEAELKRKNPKAAKVSPAFRKQYDLVDQVECQVSKLALEGSSPGLPLSWKQLDLLGETLSTALEEMEQMDQSDLEFRLHYYAILRASSIRKTIKKLK